VALSAALAELTMGTALTWSTYLRQFAVVSESEGLLLFFDPSNMEQVPLRLGENAQKGRTSSFQERYCVGQIHLDQNAFCCLHAAGADGRIAGITREGLAVVWDAESKKERRRWKAHEFMGNSIVFSPDGLRILTGGWGGAVLWDAETGNRMVALDTGEHWVSSVDIHPQNGFAAVACLDGGVRIWNPATKSKPLVIQAHEGWAGGTTFSPDGTLLATCGEDGFVRTWDPVTGNRKAERKVHASSLAWSPDGRWLAANGMDHVAVLTAELLYRESESTTLHLDWAVEFT
jgi:hypothetical protein